MTLRKQNNYRDGLKLQRPPKRNRRTFPLTKREENRQRLQRRRSNINLEEKKLLNYDESMEKKENNKRLQRRMNRENNRILNIKKQIVKENGLEQTVCYYYYLWNAVEYVGEEQVRKSFESIKGQGDEIIVGDYGSRDRTVKIAQEYGFKVVHVEKTKGITFHETKIANKVMSETKCNFMVDLNINTIYPSTMDKFYKGWINNNNVTKKLLVGRGIFHYPNGNVERDNSASCLFYVPFLKYWRGYDERAYYGWGATHYAYCLLVDVMKLELDNLPLSIHHRFHRDFKQERLRSVFNLRDQGTSHVESMKFVELLLDEFFLDINKAIANVQNSYL